MMTAEEIAMEFDVLCEKEVKVDVIDELLKDEEDPRRYHGCPSAGCLRYGPC